MKFLFSIVLFSVSLTTFTNALAANNDSSPSKRPAISYMGMGFELSWEFTAGGMGGEPDQQRFFAEVCYTLQNRAKQLHPSASKFSIETYYALDQTSQFGTYNRGYLVSDLKMDSGLPVTYYPLATACRVGLEIIEGLAEVRWMLSEGMVKADHPMLVQKDLDRKEEMASLLMFNLTQLFMTADDLSITKLAELQGPFSAMRAVNTGDVPPLGDSAMILMAKEYGIWDAMAELQRLYQDDHLFDPSVMDIEIVQLEGDENYEFFYNIGK